ncbi:hypothetical protein BJ978_001205 [Agromyces terreus]|uniref:Uncharacterized protein n=1 Tax=Agromyces terreus TaxID=424795 RepID=A0A9X2H701_9MICO|nr:hypothetical protein [Agromyces terreus]MCP2370529.1 hypothetical protein [Agromyces terreus]
MKLKHRITTFAVSVALLAGASVGVAAPAQAAQMYKEFTTVGACYSALSANVTRIKKTTKVLYAACTYSSTRGVWMHILTFQS